MGNKPNKPAPVTPVSRVKAKHFKCANFKHFLWGEYLSSDWNHYCKTLQTKSVKEAFCLLVHSNSAIELYDNSTMELCANKPKTVPLDGDFVVGFRLVEPELATITIMANDIVLKTTNIYKDQPVVALGNAYPFPTISSPYARLKIRSDRTALVLPIYASFGCSDLRKDLTMRPVLICRHANQPYNILFKGGLVQRTDSLTIHLNGPLYRAALGDEEIAVLPCIELDQSSWKDIADRKKKWFEPMRDEFMAVAWHPSRLKWVLSVG